ncbi:hypothetical protein NP233_g7854 [Leucocoprinus birnbaumii]|uniref:Uncharacterized protein n=1 Tax=Leucocoprinus birnbaumii TaxID=56174 RepID=A0AAD5YSD4_9AGAR|nr:hypothetical protein NP233_g7854 [Leucocoprinus birnbaumii]
MIRTSSNDHSASKRAPRIIVPAPPVNLDKTRLVRSSPTSDDEQGRPDHLLFHGEHQRYLEDSPFNTDRGFTAPVPITEKSQITRAMRDFLLTFREDYIEMYISPKEKGDQITFIRNHIVGPFTLKFSEISEGFVQKLDRHCRAAFTRDLIRDDVHQRRSTGKRRFREVDWKTSMARAKRDYIGDQMMQRREADGSLPRESNLRNYQQIKANMVAAASEEEKRYYSLKAEEENQKKKSPPTLEDVFSEQPEIICILQDVLRKHIGWKPGQLGDALCYLVVGYRDQSNKIKIDVTFASNHDIKSDNVLALATNTGYVDSVHKPFKRLAEEILPKEVYDMDGGLPRMMRTGVDGIIFPQFDILDVPLRHVQRLLSDFILGAWEKSSSPGNPRDAANFPSAELESHEGREALLERYEHFKALSTFDPEEMSHGEIQELVKSIGGIPDSLVFRKAELPGQSVNPGNVIDMSDNDDDDIRAEDEGEGEASRKEDVHDNESGVEDDDEGAEVDDEGEGEGEGEGEDEYGYEDGEDEEEDEDSEGRKEGDREDEDDEVAENDGLIAIRALTTSKEAGGTGKKRKSNTSRAAESTKGAKRLRTNASEVEQVEQVSLRRTSRARKPRVLEDTAPEPRRKTGRTAKQA